MCGDCIPKFQHSNQHVIVFPSIILCTFSLFLLIMGVGVLGFASLDGFFDVEFLVGRASGSWCGAFWIFFWLGALFKSKHKRIILGIEMEQSAQISIMKACLQG